MTFVLQQKQVDEESCLPVGFQHCLDSPLLRSQDSRYSSAPLTKLARHMLLLQGVMHELGFFCYYSSNNTQHSENHLEENLSEHVL